MLKININTAPILKSIDNLIDAIDMMIMKADEDLEEELKAEGYVAAGKAVETVNALEDGWTEAYNDQCDELLEQLQSALEVDDFIEKKWPKIRDSTDLRDAIYEIFKGRFLGLLEDCVVGFLAGDDPDLLTEGMEILSKPAKEFVENWSVQLADLMHLSTNEQIESILLQGQKEHLSVMQVATNISNSGIRDPGYKARRAAMTEVLRAESYGQLEAMKQNPAVVEKEWQHTGMHKNKPRPNHVAISGQRKPVDEPFDLTGADGGTYQPMCPRDINLPAGESINCHCLMKSIRDPNWKNLSVEERRALREQKLAEIDEEEDDAFHKNKDPLLDAMGPISESHPDEIQKITQEALDAGVEIIEDSPNIGYSPGLFPGLPGQLHVSTEDSYGAWLHERQHMIDDMNDGWGGFRGMFDVERRARMEYNAYKREIDLAKSIGREDVVEALKHYCREEVESFNGEWDEAKLG